MAAWAGAQTAPESVAAPPRSLPGARVWILSLTSGALSLLAAVVAARLTPAALRVPFGGGDAASLYQAVNTMIRFGWFTWNPDIGYPHGLDLAHYPNPEIHQWLLLKALGQLTGDPITAVNSFFFIGFFTVGAASYLLFHATVRHQVLAVVLAVSCATLPWHFSRFEHTLLTDYSPVPLGLLLAFLMWTRWWAHGRGRLALAILAAVYIGTGGVYYSLFACLALGPVLVGRVLSGRSWRLWWRDLAVTATIPVALVVALKGHSALARTTMVDAAFARDPLESVAFAGKFLTMFTPWPFAEGSGGEGWYTIEGDARYNVLGTLAVLACIGALVYLMVVNRPGAGRSRTSGLEAELNPWLRLFVWMTLWFVPGLGFGFAYLVSPSIRSWGRLSIVILYIATVVLGIVLRRWTAGQRRRTVAVATGLILLVSWQVLQDHREFLDPGAKAFDASAREYAAQATSALPEGCAVLQVPFMKFPEYLGPTDEMGSYDHMWPQVYAPQVRWSFGVMRGTEPAQVAWARYNPDEAPAEVLRHATEDGFCAVHIDAMGVTPSELAAWEGVLGEPDVSIGRWRLYRLPAE